MPFCVEISQLSHIVSVLYRFQSISRLCVDTFVVFCYRFHSENHVLGSTALSHTDGDISSIPSYKAKPVKICKRVVSYTKLNNDCKRKHRSEKLELAALNVMLHISTLKYPSCLPLPLLSVLLKYQLILQLASGWIKILFVCLLYLHSTSASFVDTHNSTAQSASLDLLTR